MNEVDSRTWRMNICYVAQQATMLPGTIKDNLMLSSKIHNRSFEEDFAKTIYKRSTIEGLEIMG